MVLALLKMALVICIPLVLVVGTYDPEDGRHGQHRPVRAVLHGLLVSARTLDRQHYPRCALRVGLWLEPAHTNFDPLVGLNNAFGDMLLMFVTGTMFLVLPDFLAGKRLGVGIRAGNRHSDLAVGSGSKTRQRGSKGKALREVL